MASAPLTAQAMRALARELTELQSTPPEGLRVIVNEQDLADVQAEIEGPAGTPYAGGVFRMRLALPADFPASPPKGYFTTKIWHPNVSKSGEICVNVLKKDWKPDLGLRHVLLVIRCLLIEPFPESALNEEAGKALLEDYAEYCKYARMMTDLHALPAKRPMPLATASAANADGAAGGGGGGSSAGGGGGEAGVPGSPAVKKAKQLNPALSKSKKSLKRL
ncbi:ubiquitin-conjugating enzyme E2 [Raphidocelis subcapitata]|uniref:E2 ubiquitin-conjugating enzyme n=1 Tax=Raphidocelis subcapitata TaxID=307507 RepID=A0A2V0NT98_9CHLO|nr:ubiquitin-conjugating enzyme E2 [Raphidocelis subcapitata]|eukprot:GBF89892.1 ubiquitin-conjugating enzyme E2 [Raphidocelis subcapitata]